MVLFVSLYLYQKKGNHIFSVNFGSQLRIFSLVFSEVQKLQCAGNSIPLPDSHDFLNY